MTDWTALHTIFIADSFPERLDEVTRLVSGFAPHVYAFDGAEDATRLDILHRIRGEVNTLLSAGKNMMLITNCVMGVQAGVFRIVRGYEAKYNIGARKILLSCKWGAAVNRGFKQRWQSKVGIRHVVWDGEDVRRHQDDLRRVLRSDIPLKTRLKPWETLKTMGVKEVIYPHDSDNMYQKYKASFPGEENIVWYTVIHWKRYLIWEYQWGHYVYTQLHY